MSLISSKKDAAKWQNWKTSFAFASEIRCGIECLLSRLKKMLPNGKIGKQVLYSPVKEDEARHVFFQKDGPRIKRKGNSFFTPPSKKMRHKMSFSKHAFQTKRYEKKMKKDAA